MTRAVTLGCLILAGCWSTEARRAVEEEAVRDRMEAHWTLADEARAALVDGDVERARAPLRKLADGFPAAALEGEGAAPGGVVIDAARTGAAATDLTVAATAFGRMAWGCGQCHTALDAELTLEPPTAVPADEGLTAEMARHHLAVEQIWRGLVRPSDADLTAALTTLAAAPLVPSGTPADAPLPQRAAEMEIGVHELAAEIARARGEARGEAFGRLLTTCAVCHAVVRDGAATK